MWALVTQLHSRTQKIPNCQRVPMKSAGSKYLPSSISTLSQNAAPCGKFIKLPIDMRRIAENREAVNPGCPAVPRVFIGTILVGMQIYFKNISVAFIYHRCCTTVLRHVWEKNIFPLLLERSSQLDCEITNDGKLSTGKAQISLRQENSFQSCIFWDIF